jgi:hypothetical protein
MGSHEELASLFFSIIQSPKTVFCPITILAFYVNMLTAAACQSPEEQEISGKGTGPAILEHEY